MLTYLLFIIGFVILIKGADLLVDGASAISRRFNVSDLVIGLTVVAFGTSTLSCLSTSSPASEAARTLPSEMCWQQHRQYCQYFFCFRHQCNHKASAVPDEKQPRHWCGNFFESAAVFVYAHGKKAFIRQMGGINIPRMLYGFYRLSCFHGLKIDAALNYSNTDGPMDLSVRSVAPLSGARPQRSSGGKTLIMKRRLIPVDRLPARRTGKAQAIL
jgi:hypothetical protein